MAVLSFLRKRARNLAWSEAAIAGLAMVLAGPPAGPQTAIQFPQPSPSAAPRGASTLGDNPSGQMDPALERKRLQRLNIERQKEIVSDTEKLLKLAQEFNADLEQGDDPNVSNQQMRRLAEIAKLAKNVKEKMSYTMGGEVPSFDLPGPIR